MDVRSETGSQGQLKRSRAAGTEDLCGAACELAKDGARQAQEEPHVTAAPCSSRGDKHCTSEALERDVPLGVVRIGRALNDGSVTALPATEARPRFRLSDRESE